MTVFMRSRNMEEVMAEDTSLTFGNVWTDLGSVDPNNNDFYLLHSDS